MLHDWIKKKTHPYDQLPSPSHCPAQKSRWKLDLPWMQSPSAEPTDYYALLLVYVYERSRTNLLVRIHARKSTVVAGLPTLGGNLGNFFLGTIGKIAWVLWRSPGQRLYFNSKISREKRLND